MMLAYSPCRNGSYDREAWLNHHISSENLEMSMPSLRSATFWCLNVPCCAGACKGVCVCVCVGGGGGKGGEGGGGFGKGEEERRRRRVKGHKVFVTPLVLSYQYSA